MSKISVIIPARNELFLNKTVRDILDKAAGDIDVWVNLDEAVPTDLLKDSRIHYVHPETPKGMRWGINECVKKSNGGYLLKCDAHCMFAEGFDLALLEDMQDNWLVIPRRYSLDAEAWAIQQNGKSPRDYHFLCWPDPTKGHDQGMHGVEWPERSRERRGLPEYDIDDTMSFQGSCWFMKRTWFTEFLKGMDETGYGTFSQEPQEIGNKTWLGGGEVKVNKKTWYAHLHKGKTYGRMYHANMLEIVNGHNYSAHYWMNDSWDGQKYGIKWLVKKFWPVPTWPEDWEERSYDHGIYHYT